MNANYKPNVHAYESKGSSIFKQSCSYLLKFIGFGGSHTSDEGFRRLQRSGCRPKQEKSQDGTHHRHDRQKVWGVFLLLWWIEESFYKCVRWFLMRIAVRWFLMRIPPRQIALTAYIILLFIIAPWPHCSLHDHDHQTNGTAQPNRSHIQQRFASCTILSAHRMLATCSLVLFYCTPVKGNWSSSLTFACSLS